MSSIQNVFRHAVPRDPTLYPDLRRTTLFREMSDAGLEKVLDRAAEYRIPADQYIVQGNMPSEALFVLREGAVAVVHDKVGEPVQPLAYLRRGDFFGETCVFGGKYPASVRATSACRVLRIPKKTLAELVDEWPAVEQELRRVATERHNARVEAMVELGRRREVRIRFCRRLTLILDEGETETTLESLSLSGLGLRDVPASWETGMKVTFGLRVGDKTLRLSGRIAWRRGKRLGMELVKSHPNHDALIQALISWLREKIR